MMASAALQNVSSEQVSLLTEVCLPLLLRSQNRDGGWGFHPGRMSAIEPTAWALMALSGETESSNASLAIERGCQFLLASQLDDGSWPTIPAQREGCWVTSLACLALWPHPLARHAALDGALWLCLQIPGETTSRWRIRHRLFSHSNIVPQDHRCFGWPWTIGTASWVEPTALAILALDRIPVPLLPSSAAHRVQSGQAMLTDRVCPGGGWNCGNPSVYGAAGSPAVGPTVWALLALRNSGTSLQLNESIGWLSRQTSEIRGAASLALAAICLQTFGRVISSFETQIRRLPGSSQILKEVTTLSWTAIALRTIGPAGIAAVVRH